MNFMEALQQLQFRKFVKRPGWTDGYICFMPEMKSLWKIIIVPQPNAGNWMPLVEDFLAQDWEIVEEKEPCDVVPVPPCS